MATIGPDKQLSQCVDDFIKELEDDFQSPAVSKFQDYIPRCRKGVQFMEESLSVDKSHVHKLIGSLKELFRVGELHGNSMATCADNLVKFGTTMSTTEPTLGNSFVKFGTILNQISSLLSNLASSSKNILLFSLNLLFENELKGSRYKSEMKALAGQYQSARNQVEREEKRMLVQAGINIQDRVFTSEELAGKLVTERRKFQLGVCEYMLKVNDVKTKRGVDFAEHLVGYYQAQEAYFNDGKTLLQALKSWESKFTTQISELRSKQDDERKRLLAAKDSLCSAMGIGVLKLQGPTHLDPSACTGMTDKTGYLGKRPENALRITRRPWPKRFCTVSMQGFTLAHSHTHAPHVKVPVMHFQFKDCPEPIDGRKFCFRLIAQNKTYAFDADSEKELLEWKQAMQNCQLKLFQGETSTLQRQRSMYGGSSTSTSDTRQLVKCIIAKIRSLPGNDRCVDCGAPDPEWLSVNLGILMCINCSGRHRELSVQYSRIRSLTLDQMKTPELLIALVMGNGLLNEVLEANLVDPKPTPDATTEKRQEFISNKYLQRKYIEHSIGKEALQQELSEAVDSRDIKQLLQVYAEGADLSAPLPNYSGGLTALHLAIELEDLTSLHIVDFLLGNGSRTENCTDSDGNTPLHLAVHNDNPQCVKLLLNHGASITTKNKEGETPLDIAEEKKYDECLELLQDASRKKFTKCDHIDVDWGVAEEGEEEIYQTPITESQQTRTSPPTTVGTIKRSGTADQIADALPSMRTSTKSISTSNMSNSGPRRRPMSTYLESRSSPHPQVPTQRSADNLLKSHHAPFQPSQPNMYPPPSEPAPPPPPRTVSQTAEALRSSSSTVPIAPKRKKRMTMFPEQLEDVAPPRPPKTLMIVEAEYDCDPDHRDELGFTEGEVIVVTEKLNKDWLRGYVQSDTSRAGVFPVNYVKTISPPQT